VAHCCDEMRKQIERKCDQHANRFDCPDCFVNYSTQLCEYGLIIHDGGTSAFTLDIVRSVEQSSLNHFGFIDAIARNR
jgi:hypothetical protein